MDTALLFNKSVSKGVGLPLGFGRNGEITKRVLGIPYEIRSLQALQDAPLQKDLTQGSMSVREEDSKGPQMDL